MKLQKEEKKHKSKPKELQKRNKTNDLNYLTNTQR